MGDVTGKTTRKDDLLLHNGPGSAVDFARLHKTYFAQVRSFLRYLGSQRADLDDAVQEVFLRAWQNRSHYRTEGSMRAYLLSIATNVSRERWRIARRGLRQYGIDNAPTASDDSANQPCIIAVEREEAYLVRTAVTQLPTRQRHALELIDLAGLATGQAAEILCVSYHSLRRQRRLAYKRLRTLLRQTQCKTSLTTDD